MIIWLASYPKSGNTLLRSMLSAYLFSNDGIFNFKLLPKIKQFPYNDILERLGIKSEEFNEIIKNSIRGQELFNKKNTVGFLKTHNMLFNYEKKYPFTNLENTLGGSWAGSLRPACGIAAYYKSRSYCRNQLKQGR